MDAVRLVMKREEILHSIRWTKKKEAVEKEKKVRFFVSG